MTMQYEKEILRTLKDISYTLKGLHSTVNAGIMILRGEVRGDPAFRKECEDTASVMLQHSAFNRCAEKGLDPDEVLAEVRDMLSGITKNDDQE